MSKKSAAIVQKDEGRVLRAFGDEVVIHLDGECTGGAVTMWTGTLPPGGGPPPHYHLNEDETFHVLEGRVAFLLGGEWREVGPGASAFMPRGVVHTFKNVGDQPSRILIMTTPRNFSRVVLMNSRSPAGRIRRESYRSALNTEFIFYRGSRLILTQSARP